MRKYIPKWIDKYTYTIIVATIQQYPTLKLNILNSESVRKINAIESALSQISPFEREIIQQRFFDNKKISDIQVPYEERTIKRKIKSFICAVGYNLGEINEVE